jgi:hypothetical protein
MGLDDQCINNGGVWCTLDAAWASPTQRLLVLAMVVCLMLIVFMTLSRVARGVRDFKESRKGDL